MPEVKIIMKVSIAPTSACGTSSPAGSRSVDVDNAHAGEVEPVEQLGVLVVDQHQLAVGAPDVGEQRRTRAGWC